MLKAFPCHFFSLESWLEARRGITLWMNQLQLYVSYSKECSNFHQDSWHQSTGDQVIKTTAQIVFSPFAFAPSGMVFLKLSFGKLMFNYFRSV